MKKNKDVWFIGALLILIVLIALAFFWPNPVPPQPPATPSYTITPSVTSTVTPTPTHNPTNTPTPIISPTLTITPTLTPTFIISITSTPYPIPESTGYRCDWWRWDRPIYECFVDKDYKSCYWKWCR